MPIAGNDAIGKVLTLNRTARAVWELVDGEHSVGAIVLPLPTSRYVELCRRIFLHFPESSP